jgi:hypothetical protein
MLRAVLDLRLPAVVSGERVPADIPPADRLRAMLLALGLRWGGAPGSEGGEIDRGLRMLAGWREDGPDTVAALHAVWAASEGEHESFQATLLRALLGQRLAGGSTLHLHALPLAGAQALVAGDESAALWPLATVVRSPDEVAGAMERWSATWARLAGHEPTFVLGQELAAHAGPRALVAGAGDDASAARHQSSRSSLEAALDALEHGRLGEPMADLTVAITAVALLRGWCRWMPHFGESSVPYLLKHFVHRPGAVSARPDGLLVELAPLPLDMIIRMSGYTADIESAPWLGGQRLRFLMQS